MNGIRRFREPVAWVVLVVVIVLGLGSIALQVYQAITGGTSWLRAAAELSDSIYDPLSAIALTAVVAACVLIKPPSDHARRLTDISAWFALLALGLQLILGLIGLGASGSAVTGLIDFVGLITLNLVPALSAWLLWRFRKNLSESGIDSDDVLSGFLSSLGQGKSSTNDSAAVSEVTPEPDPDPQEQRGPPTVWRPNEASGAVWKRASDAAAGVEASGWGQSGSGIGWTPIGPAAGGDPSSQPTPERSVDAESAKDQRSGRGVRPDSA